MEISLVDIAEIYTELAGALGARHRPPERHIDSEDLVTDMKYAYQLNSLVEEHIDFANLDGLDEKFVAIGEACEELGDLYSVCQVFKGAGTRSAVIILNTNIPDVGTRRFCRVKEACHAILYYFYTEEDRDGRFYVPDIDDEAIFELLTSSQNSPISTWDFGNEGYSSDLKMEHAAELLASLLLVDIDDLKSLRATLKVGRGGSLLAYEEDADFAKKWLIPVGYANRILTHKSVDEIIKYIEIKVPD